MIEPPIGQPCVWCGEAFTADDKGVALPYAGASAKDPPEVNYHRECFLRTVIGSVAHLEQRCTCCGGTEHDPPGISLRQAAIEAVELHERQQKDKQKAMTAGQLHIFDPDPPHAIRPAKDAIEWADHQATHKYLGDERHNGVRIATIFDGFDPSFSDPPRYFETMIFGGKHHHKSQRYETHAEALAGHQEMVALVKGDA